MRIEELLPLIANQSCLYLARSLSVPVGALPRCVYFLKTKLATIWNGSPASKLNYSALALFETPQILETQTPFIYYAKQQSAPTPIFCTPTQPLPFLLNKTIIIVTYINDFGLLFSYFSSYTNFQEVLLVLRIFEIWKVISAPPPSALGLVHGGACIIPGKLFLTKFFSYYITWNKVAFTQSLSLRHDCGTTFCRDVRYFHRLVHCPIAIFIFSTRKCPQHKPKHASHCLQIL